MAPPPRKRKEQKDPKPAKTKAKRKSTELDAPREADPEEDERDDQPDEDDEELHLDPIVQAERDEEIVVPTPDVAWNAEVKWTKHTIEEAPATETRQGVIQGHIVPTTTKKYAGAISIPASVKSPADFMNLLWDGFIFARFVMATNLFVSHQPIPSWTPANDLTEPELRKFFGLHLYMGIKRIPDRNMYWSKGIMGDDYVRSVMSRNRFMAIQANLHWTDTSLLTGAERTAKNKADGFWSIRGLLFWLTRNFQRYFECGRELDIDEMTVPFKGRHRARVYNPNKPNKWGLKAFCLNDAVTGYLSNFFMYLGKDEERPEGQPATLYPVIKLTEPALYHGRAHILCTDNWYTQVDAAVIVSAFPRLMDYVGTIKVNKKGLPKKGIFSKVGPTQKKRGEMVCYKVTKDEVTFYFTSWQDTKPVHVLSTFQPFLDTCERNMKTAAGGWGGKEEIPKPTVVSAYNRAMGGTDLGDQLNSYYQDRHRVRFWQQRMYNHFLHVATNNAKVLMNSWVKKSAVQANKTLLTFQAMVSEEWCGAKAAEEADGEDEPQMQQEKGRPENRKQWWKREYKTRSTGKHRPHTVEAGERRVCMICGKKIASKCSNCDVFLCFGPSECFDHFHDQEDPWAE